MKNAVIYARFSSHAQYEQSIEGQLAECHAFALTFSLKGGQKNELLLNLIFPDYPDGNSGADKNGVKEKETENSVSQSGCSYTPVMVPVIGVEPIRIISPPDFESGASANSTTPAVVIEYHIVAQNASELSVNNGKSHKLN